MLSSKDIQKDNLYLYTLSEELKGSLDVLYFDSSTTIVAEQTPTIASPESEIRKDACTACNVALGPSGERRDHYRSDLHRLNLKRNVEGLPPLNDTEFDKLIENESIESLLGTQDSSSDDEDEKSSKLDTIMEKLSFQTPDDEENTVSYMNTKSPYILFKSPLLPLNRAFGVYKSVFNSDQLDLGPLESLKAFSSASSKQSALFMIGGGHFAGAIVSHVRRSTKGNAPSQKESRQEQAVNIVVSKTFHRYTTRKKQGGSQSASDNARGKANSAGSSIRRYNEQALVKEVRELLASWKGYLDKCDSVFVRANGPTSRKILVGYEDAPLQTGDKRIRSFPFTTKRATTSQLKKAWVNLSYLQVVEIPKSEKKNTKPDGKVSKTASPAPEVSAKEVSADERHSIELVGFLKKSKAPFLVNYLRKNDLSSRFELEPKDQYAHTPTMLHYAASQGLHFMVLKLLINLKADPRVTNSAGKTPYQVASNTETRNAFQSARYSLGEELWDWNAAGVGKAKSKETFEKEALEKAEQEKMHNRRMIQEELEKKTDLDTKKNKPEPGFSLGGISATAEISGLSDQQKMRLMREQRARAAEARFRKP